MNSAVLKDKPVVWTDQAIYERIVESVLDHRLSPGTRLTEDRLCGIFGVSRTRIKPILVRLANERIITLTHNRGASVSQPTQQESIEVFEVRRLIEPVLVLRFIDNAQAHDIAHLSNMIAQENEAQRAGDWNKAVRLSGQFHLYIAEIAGHETFGRIMHELISRNSLIIMAWGSRDTHVRSQHAACGCQEHKKLLDAIRLRDLHEAPKQMVDHLNTIEAQLNFSMVQSQSVDLEQLLQD